MSVQQSEYDNTRVKDTKMKLRYDREIKHYKLLVGWLNTTYCEGHGMT